MPAFVSQSRQPARGNVGFTETHWATVLDAGRGDDSQRAHAGLAQLCETYWPPVYSYLRRQGHRPDDAKDLTQEFFCRLIDRQYLKSLVPEKGKFRFFLLVLLNRFLADERDRANCQKRGGGRPVASWDARALELSYRREPLDDRTPEKIFERQWVLTLLQQVLDRLGTACGLSWLLWQWISRTHLTQNPHPQPLSQPLGEGGVGLSPRPQGGEGESLPRLASRPTRHASRNFRFSASVLLASAVVLSFWQFRHTENPLARRVFSIGNPNDFSWRNRVATWSGAVIMMKDRPWGGARLGQGGDCISRAIQAGASGRYGSHPDERLLDARDFGWDACVALFCGLHSRVGLEGLGSESRTK